MIKNLAARKRAHKFVPQLMLLLQQKKTFSGNLSDLPKSYQDQPHNLIAKLLSRGGIKAQVFVNREHNTITINTLKNHVHTN